ncbi:MAG TPA: TatD family nuclease-associated radical SAM protein [Patescibacteria group bacterium]|nr:TatD family nuclease-associated radical SAM protein [Patescibacteria group bacterium]
MTITYELGESLYLNITNRCTNRCTFCVRNQPDGVAEGIDLWLKGEPEAADVLAEIRERDASRYREIVFCGYGEPLTRLDTVLEICQGLKKQYPIPIRINTNGQANLIYGRDITAQLAAWVDAVSISLNAKNKREYQLLCQSDYGEDAFDALLDFAVKCRQHIPKVALSVVDLMPAADIEICRQLAAGIGVDYKIRHLVG